jgi:hypothetical protein
VFSSRFSKNILGPFIGETRDIRPCEADTLSLDSCNMLQADLLFSRDYIDLLIVEYVVGCSFIYK